MNGRLNVIPDVDFKYTVDPMRKEWVKNMSPVTRHLLDIIRSMPWNSFRYDRDISWGYPVDIDKSASFSPNMSSHIRAEYASAHVTASTESFCPYYYFGGYCYEILNLLYPSKYPADGLRKFVDPTGDIDVKISLPEIKLTSADPQLVDPISYLFNADGTMNDLLRTYTDWIFENLQVRLSDFASTPDFRRLMVNAIPFNHLENEESQYADRIAEIGPLKLVRIIYPGNTKNLKIQLLVKLNSMSESDHLLEFVLNINNSIADPSFLRDIVPVFINNYTIFKGIPIEALHNLFQGNFSGMKDRFELATTSIRHKFYNHVGRIQFLNEFLQTIEYGIDSNSQSLISVWIKIFIQTLERMDNICLYDYTFVPGEDRCTNIRGLTILYSMFYYLKKKISEKPRGIFIKQYFYITGNKDILHFRECLQKYVPDSLEDIPIKTADLDRNSGTDVPSVAFVIVAGSASAGASVLSKIKGGYTRTKKRQFKNKKNKKQQRQTRNRR